MADTCSLLADSQLQLCTGQGVGRYLVASKAFKPGDVIFRNHPSTYLLSTEYWGDKCLRCFNPAYQGSSLMQCAKCKKATYCGRNCQVGDWKQHKYECPHVQTIVGQNLPPSAVNEVLLLLRSTGIRATQPSECRKQSDGSILCGGNHSEGVYYNPLAPVESADLILASVTGRHCQAENPYLLRRLQQFHCNNFGVVDDLINCIGSAEYPATALLNHSCVPNCILRYDLSPQGPILEVTAIAPIAEGDELCHSYTDCSSPTFQRQQRLRDTYKFTCQCKLCSATVSGGESLDRSLSSAAVGSLMTSPLKLRRIVSDIKKQNPSVLLAVDHLLTETSKETSSPPSPHTSSFITTTCRVVAATPPSELLSKQRDIETRAIQAESTSDIAIVYEEMKELEAALEQFYGPMNQDLYHYRCKMLSTVLLTENYLEAKDLCAKIVSYLVISMANIPFHPLLAVQLFTLADLSASLGDSSTSKYYDWCEELLRTTHGDQSRLVSHLQSCRT